jgi:hypothetical protein
VDEELRVRGDIKEGERGLKKKKMIIACEGRHLGKD